MLGFYIKKRYKKTGFTLAEILITLLIIGVVSSIVIPTLINDMQDQELHTAWKKAYSDMSQATKRLSMDYAGNLSGMYTVDGDHDSFRDKLLTYMNYVKKCGAVVDSTGPNGCWHAGNSWYKLSGQTYGGNWSGMSRAVLNNGTLLAFDSFSASCTATNAPNHDLCGNVYIDINGYKGPNKIGKDIYAIEVLRNGTIIPTGTTGDAYNTNSSVYTCDVASYPSTTGWNCSAQYLYQ